MSHSVSEVFAGPSAKSLVNLSNETLGDVPESIPVPNYPRIPSKAGAMHFGWGAFASALLGPIHDEMLKMGVTNAGIIGVIPRLRINPATGKCDAVERADALRKQDFIYSVREQDLTTDKTYIVGSLMDIMVGPDDRQAVYERMAEETIQLVTATVTQKGYEWDVNKGTQEDRDKEKLDQFANYVAEGLALRFQRGMKPFAVMSCDNIGENGKKLKGLVEYFAREKHIDGFNDWVSSQVTFYNTMVDRITPSITEKSRQEMRKNFGVIDAQPIVTEGYRELVIGVDDNIPAPPFPYEDFGGQYTPNVVLHEKAKIGMLNGSHMAAGVIGRVREQKYIANSLSIKSIFNDVSGFMSQIKNVLDPVPDRDLDTYGPLLIERFQNPHTLDQLQRLARNGIDKVKERFFDPLRLAYNKGLPQDKIISAIAHWIVYVGKANNDPLLQEDTENGFFIEDQKAYDHGYVNVFKSCNGAVSPVFVLPMFAQMENDFPQFRADLQKAYTEITHPTNDNLNPATGNDKSAHTPNGPS